MMLSGYCQAHETDNKGLTIFVDDSYPPYMYKVNGTDADGLYPRLIEEIAKHAGQRVDIKAYPWARALSEGGAGHGAIGGAYKNDSRIELYDFSNPIYQEKLVIFVNKNSPFEFNGIEDLKGKMVGVNRAWSYGQAFDSARDEHLFSVNIRNDLQDNFKMLALGRIDCVILDELSGMSYIRLMGLESDILALPKAFSNNNAYLILNKDLKMNTFMDTFNAALDELHQNGGYERIVQTFIADFLDK